jgi:hypothetical protein
MSQVCEDFEETEELEPYRAPNRRRQRARLRQQRRERLSVQRQSDVVVLDMGAKEMWDGADLSLLREQMTNIGAGSLNPSIAIEMRHVKYLASGFFGTLFDWREKNGARSVRLYSPQPCVRQMIWFQQFFIREADECYILV